MAPTCKCHGVSGSCSIKTCWKALPDVRQFGLALQKRYATALEIRARRDRRSRERRLVAVQRSRRSVAEDELVYYTISPDYCLPDNSLGSVGTRGRYDMPTYGEYTQYTEKNPVTKTLLRQIFLFLCHILAYYMLNSYK